MNAPVLLDSSFLIALEREAGKGETGPAHKFLPRLAGRKIVVSVISVEEILGGAANEAAGLRALQRFSIQGLHSAHTQKCGRLQCRAGRRLGENDARLVATAEAIGGAVVGADRTAFERLRDQYLRFR